MSSSNQVRVSLVKEDTYGELPSSGVKASLVVQDLTYTAKKFGAGGNGISIAYVDGATAGSETVAVTDKAIVVTIDDGASTATQVKAAIDGDTDAAALVSVAISGTAGDFQVAAAAAFLANGTGDFKTIRFVSESLSGSPTTVESAQIRTDRLSSGQVVTGLEVGGQISFELAKEPALEELMQSAMLNTWNTMGLVTRALTISGATITSVSGSFITDGLKVGDFIQLAGFTAPANNAIVMITSVAANTLGFVGNGLQVNGTGGSTTYKRMDKLTIGTTPVSYSMVKEFLDLSDKAINYKGMVANEMELTVEYGALISGSFTFNGNGYEAVELPADYLNDEFFIADAATTNSLNGSVDMPFVATDISGSFSSGAFCIQTLGLQLANNYNPQNCVGEIAPTAYTPGQASVSVNLTSYLKDSNWDMLQRKLSQDSFGLGFVVKNGGGAYAAFLPAIQVSFDDPASGGANQDVQMEMSGSAKVGAAGESSLTLFRL